jgi:phosphonatase-like hydrolase
MALLMKNNITLLVCDMAGTIVNERGIIYTAIKSTLSHLGFFTPDNEEKKWYGRDKTEVIRDVITSQIMEKRKSVKYPLNIENLVRQAEQNLVMDLEKTYFDNGKISLIDPTLLDMFENLRINGVKIALNTGYPERLQSKIIDHFQLKDNIDAYISSDRVKFGRPAPYMIYHLMEECEIYNVANVAKIGDTVNDMREGKNAGCGLTIGVLTGAEQKKNLVKYGDIVINEITDLRNDELPIFLL